MIPLDSKYAPARRGLGCIGGRLGLIATLAALSISTIGISPAEAQNRPAPRVVEGGATLKRMRVTVNKSQTLRVDVPFSDVLVGSAEIADVMSLSEKAVKSLLSRARGRLRAVLQPYIFMDGGPPPGHDDGEAP